jgi:regulator of sirC expression with transglutaminase-like and TPR domain
MLSRSFQDMMVRLLGALISLVLTSTSTLFAGEVLDRLLMIEQSEPTLCKSALGAGSSRQRIFAMAAEFRSRVKGSAASPDSTVAALNGIIFGPGGIRSSQDLHDPCNLLMSGVLARSQGYCVGVAAVYLTVADELDLPVYAVGTPSHVFLRYDDGTTRINIETFNGGASITDEQYISQNRIAVESVKKRVFLEDLSTDRFLAQVHNNLGVIYSERREFEKAAAEYDEALRLDRRLPTAWYNLGKDRFEQRQFKGAISAFTMALKLHPNDTWALNNRGMAYKALEKTPKARGDFEAALGIDPAFEQAKHNLVQLDATR